MFITVASKRSSGWPRRGICRALLGCIVVYLFSSGCTWNCEADCLARLHDMVWILKHWVFVHVGPLQGFFKCWFRLSHHCCGTSDHRTMNCQLVHLLLFIEGHLSDGVPPPPTPPPLKWFHENGPLTFEMFWGEKKKTLGGILSIQGVLITTVITTKYPHSHSTGGFSA